MCVCTLAHIGPQLISKVKIRQLRKFNKKSFKQLLSPFLIVRKYEIPQDQNCTEFILLFARTKNGGRFRDNKSGIFVYFAIKVNASNERRFDRSTVIFKFGVRIKLHV